MQILYTISFLRDKSYIELRLLGSFKDKLCLADWRYRKMRASIDKIIQKGLKAEYFEEKRKVFNIPILLVGTDFQKKVWEALIKIPYGKTDSYLGLSKKLENEKAVRAVATANGANAISIIVPCHRIIGSNGNLVGYAGGLNTKKKLLNLEGYLFDGQLKMF